MKSLNKILLLGWVAFATSWFLPVHEFSRTISEGVVPGWEVAVDVLSGEGGALGVLSGLTNFLMLLTIPVAVFASRKGKRVLALACFVACLLNATWWIRHSHDAGFMAGYYLWTVSFLVVGVGLWALARLVNGGSDEGLSHA